MSSETTISSTDPQIQTLIELEVFRGHDGIHIKAKSEPIENLMRSQHSGSSMLRVENWGSVTECYRIGRMLENSDFYYAVNYFGNGYNLIISEGQNPNLAFLRAKGLSEGIEVIYPIAVSELQIDDFMKKAAAKIEQIYETLMRPRVRKLKITCQLN